jgi:penicillin-binding protein 1C
LGRGQHKLKKALIDFFKKRFLRKKNILIVLALIIVLFLSVPLPNPLFPLDYSTVVLDEDGKILRTFLNSDEQWSLPPLQDFEVPEKLKKAVLCFEDRHFYRHPGVNIFSLFRALYQNISSGRVVSGASTITMQVARLMHPKKRTCFNKALEILQALKIELRYSKEEILRLYLNHAPYGENLIGCQAASLGYFQKMPEQLTWAEAATLAVLPNSPALVSPRTNSQQLRVKRDRLLRKLMKEGTIDKDACQLALLEDVPGTSRPFGMSAPHLAQSLKNQNEEESTIIQTTIKNDIQQRTEDLVRDHFTYLNPLGIRNGAALIAETQSGKVRAYVGSQDFYDEASQGQVDGVRAPRSSGSLLKPFLYALSIDEGIILPETLVKDIPSFYGTFSPNNANEKFSGMVTAKEALVCSLNVPAVRLLYTYGLHRFYHFLKAAGLRTLFRTADDYGLPLIIGGAEVTLWDMAALFRALGDSGQFRPLQILKNSEKEEESDTPLFLISPGACYLTLNMLRELKRPGAEYYWHQYQNQWPLAWKTGTSYGQRDGWAVGVSPQWVVAVWIGNFDGEGNANLSGASCAGPLLFDIFNSLPKNPQKSWFKKPLMDLAPVEVCQDTGFLAGEHCEKKIAVEAPLHMKPLEICPYHQSIYVNEEQTHQVCSLCWQPGHYKRISVLVYPPDVVQYLRGRGQVISAIPVHNPECPAQAESLPLQILYPQQDSKLWIPRDFDGNLQKVTMRVAHRERNRILYWYLNDHYLGSSSDQHLKAVALTKGWHVLEVVDELGNRDRKAFYAGMRDR